MPVVLVDAVSVTAVLAGRAPTRGHSKVMGGVMASSVPARLAAGLALVQLTLLSTLVTRQLRGAGSSNWDLGIFNNAVWTLAHGQTFMTYRGMDVLGHHFNLIFFAYAPFSWLGAGALFLCLTQCVVLTLGAIPAYLLGRDRLKSNGAGLVICAVYLLHPAVTGLTWWMFHPEALAIPAVMLAWWAATAARWRVFAAAIAFALICREDVSLATAGIGLVLLFGSRWPSDGVFHSRTAKRAGVVTLLVSALWYVGVTQVVMPSRLPTDEPYYVQDFFGNLGSTMPEVISTSLLHPGRALAGVQGMNGVSYAGRLLGPTGGLALLSPLSLIPALPQLAAATISNDPDSRQPWHHHAAIVTPFMIIAAVEGVRRWAQRPSRNRRESGGRVSTEAQRRSTAPVLRPERLRLALGWMLGWSLLSYLVLAPTPLGPLGGRWQGSTAKGAAVRAAAQQLSATASVVATITPGNELTLRSHIYTWPAPWKRWRRGWEGLDLPNPAVVDALVISRDEVAPKLQPLLARLTSPTGPFRITWERDGVLVAVRRWP